MELTPQELKIAATADSHTFAVFRRKVYDLKRKGHHKAAQAAQADYDKRLERWKNKIKGIASEGV